MISLHNFSVCYYYYFISGYINSFVYNMQTHKIKIFSNWSFLTANKKSRHGRKMGTCLYNM